MAASTSHPNLDALLGVEVAAELVRLAGGLGPLAQLPASAMRHLGAMSSSTEIFDKEQKFKAGVMLKCSLVDGVSRDHKFQAVTKLANKARLAAGVDASASRPDASYGSQLRDELAVVFDAMDAPPPGRAEKPMAIPKDPEAKTRAGQKFQRINGKFKETIIEEKASIVEFGKDVDKQREALMRSRDVLSAMHAAKQEEDAKQRRIAENGGRPNTKGSSASRVGDKRGREDTSDLLDLTM
jgi:hypothetical protein